MDERELIFVETGRCILAKVNIDDFEDVKKIRWIEQFEHERAKIRLALRDKTIVIEHIRKYLHYWSAI
jgi:GrpB-like predicted nucleotidyltransferase (UPF0157 family)